MTALADRETHERARERMGKYSGTTELLQERGTTHGSFADNARNGQMLREAFRSSPKWAEMPLEHREALDHIAGKLSRILSGQSRFRDHWVDVIGYSQLALDVCDKG